MEVSAQALSVSAFERLTEKAVARTGRIVSWLILVMVVLIFSIVILRYGLNLGWIWLQECVSYLHSAVFLLAAAWAFQVNEHVRVDIFYRHKSLWHKAWVDLAGTLLFVVPFSVFLFWTAWGYVAASWSVMEGSREAGGLDFVYVLKSLMLVLPVLLLLQSTTYVMHNLRILRVLRESRQEPE